MKYKKWCVWVTLFCLEKGWRKLCIFINSKTKFPFTLSTQKPIKPQNLIFYQCFKESNLSKGELVVGPGVNQEEGLNNHWDIGGVGGENMHNLLQQASVYNQKKTTTKTLMIRLHTNTKKHVVTIKQWY